MNTGFPGFVSLVYEMIMRRNQVSLDRKRGKDKKTGLKTHFYFLSVLKFPNT